MIITIDGGVATGKSTIARKLADALGFIFFDTGAMYRTITFGILKHEVDYKDVIKVEEFLRTFEFDIKVFRGEKSYFYEGENITQTIRNERITEHVSKIAAISAVRKKLVDLQRKLSSGVNAVFEGRDMGTTVFPNAYLKIFLTGSLEVRAERRFQEMIHRFPELKETLDMEQLKKDIIERDKNDTSRKISPLRQADDAFEIDTSNLEPDEVVFKILECKDSVKI